jgi:hypothetical protein
MYPCRDGEYCPLGRTSNPSNRSSLLCPSGTFCEDSSIIEPKLCVFDIQNSNAGKISYCPPGRSNETKCPAGYFCPTPIESVKCAPSYTCPEGTFVPQQCPKGYYCTTPATPKKKCPRRYFCKEGSVRPARCPPLSICPPGSSEGTHGFIGPVVIIVVVISILLITRTVQYFRAQYDILLNSRVNKNIAHELLEVDTNRNPLVSESEPSDRFEMDIAFKNLGLQIPNGSYVLNGVNGELLSGKLTAVMGLSGCGKSTFITAVSTIYLVLPSTKSDLSLACWSCILWKNSRRYLH